MGTIAGLGSRKHIQPLASDIKQLKAVVNRVVDHTSQINNSVLAAQGIETVLESLELGNSYIDFQRGPAKYNQALKHCNALAKAFHILTASERRI